MTKQPHPTRPQGCLDLECDRRHACSRFRSVRATLDTAMHTFAEPGKICAAFIPVEASKGGSWMSPGEADAEALRIRDQRNQVYRG